MSTTEQELPGPVLEYLSAQNTLTLATVVRHRHAARRDVPVRQRGAVAVLLVQECH